MWWCDPCAFFNFAYRQECRQCGMGRGDKAKAVAAWLPGALDQVPGSAHSPFLRPSGSDELLAPCVRLASEEAGTVTSSLPPAIPYLAADYGWTGTILTGMTMDVDAFGTKSAGGIQVDSIADSLVFLSIRNRTEKRRIALAYQEDDL